MWLIAFWTVSFLFNFKIDNPKLDVDGALLLS